MYRVISILSCAAAGAFLILHASRSAQSLAVNRSTIEEITSPAGPKSAGPNLVAGADESVYLSWVETTDSGKHALRFSKFEDNRWSTARRIAEGERWFANWADFPSLSALRDGTLAAHWLVKSGPGTYAYDVNLALSRDRGRTWSQPFKPHGDGTRTEHGFVSLLPRGDSHFAAIWLDGRNFKEDASHEGHSPSKYDMTLRYAAVDKQGRISEEVQLDERVCECCQTSAAVTSEGIVAVYRDRSDTEVRDIAVIRQVKGGWTKPRLVHNDGWEINGCPVNGPAVAARGKVVAVAWFTAAKQTPRVNLAFSTDAGATFGDAIRIDEGSPAGRVDIALLSDASAVVSWLERRSGAADIKLRRVGLHGAAAGAITIAGTGSNRASGFPRIEQTKDKVLVAWTQPGGGPGVRTALVDVGK